MKRFTAAAATLILAAGLGVATASSASAYPATGCEEGTQILASQPVTLLAPDAGSALGELYLGYFPGCHGVYAEIHWYSPATTDYTQNPPLTYLDSWVSGEVGIKDEFGNTFGWVSFNYVANQQYVASTIESIHYNNSGVAYPAPEEFTAVVEGLVVQNLDSNGIPESHDCGPVTLYGNPHSFYTGGNTLNGNGNCLCFAQLVDTATGKCHQ